MGRMWWDVTGPTGRLCTRCDGKRATRNRRLRRAALPLTSVALRAPSASGKEKPKPDRLCAIKTGHLHVLTTSQFKCFPTHHAKMTPADALTNKVTIQLTSSDALEESSPIIVGCQLPEHQKPWMPQDCRCHTSSFVFVSQTSTWTLKRTASSACG